MRVSTLKQIVQFLSIFHFVLFLAVLGLSFTVPIYTDEIEWKMILARYFLNGNTLVYLFPQCKSTFLTQPPLWMLPVFSIQALLYANLSSLFKLRLFGCLSFFAWIFFTWKLAVRLPQFQNVSPKKVLVFWTSYLSIGVLPFALVLNRPEQPLIWGLALLTFAPLVLPLDRFKLNLWGSAAIALANLAVWVVLFTLHPKVTLFLPLLLVSLFSTVRFWRWRILASVALFLVVFQTQQFWKTVISCPEDPQVDAFLNSHSLKPELLVSHPTEFFERGTQNLRDISEYFRNLNFSRAYPQDWLPARTKGQTALAKTSNSLFKYRFAFFILIVLRGLILRVRRSPRWDSSLAIIIGLTLSLGSWTFVQTVKNFYEIGLFFPLLGLLLILGFTPEDFKKNLKLSYSFGTLILMIGLISQFNLICEFLPQAVGPWIQGGYLKGQRVSFSAFHMKEQKELIREAASLCGLPGKNTKYLGVDDLTYSAFWDTNRTISVMNLSTANSQINSFRLLQDYRSSGLITNCELLNADLRGRSIQKGQFCCMGPFSRE